jgi:hypothetical protein
MKPFKGHISNWNKQVWSEPKDEHLGFVVRGRPSGHPEFEDFIRTSLVVKMDEPIEEAGETIYLIETLNSRYKLIGHETVTPFPSRV